MSSNVRHFPDGAEIWCGRIRVAPHARHGSAVHDYAVIALHLEGEAVVEQSGRFQIAPGALQLIPAGHRHAWVSAERIVSYGVGFCPSCLRAAGLGDLLAPFQAVRRGQAPVRRVDEQTGARMRAVLELLAEECQRPNDPRSALIRRAHLSVVLAELARTEALAPQREPSLAAEALAFVEVHAFEPLRLKDVADAVRRSPAHLTTAVRRETGMTVGQWIAAFRMADARRRLRDTDEHIDVIGERVGYLDPSHFGRLFRRMHGESPGAWRRRARGR